MYYISNDVKTAKKELKECVDDTDTILEIVGEKESVHITRKGFGVTTDGRIIIEIPRTLKNIQDNILASIYTDRLKTKEDIKNYTPRDSADVVG